MDIANKFRMLIGYGIEGRTRVAWLGVKVKLSGLGFSSIWTYCSMITT